MKCENCGATLRPDLEHAVYVCDYCDSEFVPPPEADGVLVVGESTRACPVCARRLSKGSLEMNSLEYCTGCHGMLIAMDGLMGLVEALGARRDRFSGHIEPRSQLDAARHLRCPVCRSEMDGHPYGGGGNVNVDSCEKCGLLWLDGGELRRIATARDHDSLYGEGD